MPRTIETIVHALEELSGTAKRQARAWYRETCFDHDWHDFVYEDFETVCRILGVTLATGPVPLMGGGTREKPHVRFSGFQSQGDGASFEGSYRHAAGAGRAIRAYAPQDAGLHRIADALQAAQRRNFYQLTGDIRQSGRHCHECTMAIRAGRDSPAGQDPADGSEDILAEAMRDLARWLYRQLEREYDHQTSDAVVDETIAANGWTFTQAGRRFG